MAATTDEHEGIGSPVRLFRGHEGTYWAWPIDGYYDIHVTDGESPDGSDVIIEDFLTTLAESRRAARRYDSTFAPLSGLVWS